MQLRRKRDGLVLARVERPQREAALWAQDLYPRRRVTAQSWTVSARADASVRRAQQVGSGFVCIAV
jgi:hypothetical protein